MRRYLIPPFWFLLGIACELALARRAPIAPVLPPPLHWIGAIGIVAGVVITNWAVIWFKRKKTGLLAFTPTTALIVSVVHRMFVLPEEAHMERAMGGDYLAYKARIRRWL